MGIDALAKRYSSLIICLMLAVAAYFQARGVGGLLVATLLAATPAPAVPSHRRAPAAAGDVVHETSATAILERNPFDSVTGPIAGGERGGVPLPGVQRAERDPYEDPPCDMARVVLITSADDPDWSFAAITTRDGKTALHRRGDTIDGHAVIFIGRLGAGGEDDRLLDDRVWLATATGRCQLELGAAPLAKAGGAKAAQPGAPPSDLASKVRKVGEHAYEVDRTTVDALLANPAELMKTRVVPDREGDRVVGVRLFNIRPNSLLGALGLENGDRLSSINGFEMTEPQKMLEAYSKLTTANNLSVTVVRNGQPIGLEVGIK
jgi:general secretion pathway protein C